MAEYIEREAAVLALREKAQEYEYIDECIALDYLKAADRIKKLPAADVAPVVHGRWEFSRTTEDKFAIVKCSNCGHKAFAIAFYVIEGNYCPNCGARMELEAAP